MNETSMTRWISNCIVLCGFSCFKY
ncbi:hypothetical protein OIU76_024784 [Salix suchowensis]|nr:hypothetical protein OIU76_024784 [Salix suchowensis]